jgi:RNA polymerase sigma-70 factor (ECF subfamily)
MNIALQYIQKKKESDGDFNENKIIPYSGNLSGKESVLTFDEIKFAIQQLPERYRLPVVLKFVEGMTYEEISRFTGESPGEIKGILNRAVKQLQKYLDKSDGEFIRWQDVHK